MRTWAVVAPFVTSTTLPLSRLRALIFMTISPLRVRLGIASGPGYRNSVTIILALFAVEIAHRHGRIALAGGGILGHHALDGGEIVGAKDQIERAERFRQAVAAAGADQRHDVPPLRHHPGDRHLGDACLALLGHIAQRLDQREVAVDILALETRADGAEIAGAGGVLAPM